MLYKFHLSIIQSSILIAILLHKGAGHQASSYKKILAQTETVTHYFSTKTICTIVFMEMAM